MYMILPETTATSWLPIVGITLVCLPWFFWLSTFLYRVFSRVFGCRIGVGGCSGGGESNDNNGAKDDSPSPFDRPPPEESGQMAENGARQVQFEAAVTVHENDERDQDHDRSKDSIVSRNSSVVSHESELPLASSMAC